MGNKTENNFNMRLILILTIYNHETVPIWTGRTGILPLHILMTGSLTSPKNMQLQNTSPTSPP